MLNFLKGQTYKQVPRFVGGGDVSPQVTQLRHFHIESLKHS